MNTENAREFIIGIEATALPSDYDALDIGKKNQTNLVGQTVSGPIFNFVPIIDQYLKSHLFGDIFSRDILSWQMREIITLSILAAIQGLESQIKAHIEISLNIGITVEQLQCIRDELKNVSIDIQQNFSNVLKDYV